MEGGLAEAQAAFAMLDAQMSRESQTAAKIGDRLHVSSLHCVASHRLQFATVCMLLSPLAICQKGQGVRPELDRHDAKV